MKIAMTLCLIFLLTACCTPVPPVYIPVYKEPVITMPARPVLRSNGIGEDGVITKNVELDLLDLKTYSLELENILNELKIKK